MAYYYTTSSSTLAGLSARAYDSSVYFRETKNEIISRSLYKDLFRSRPSQLFMSLFPSEEYLIQTWLPIFDLHPKLEDHFLINLNIYNTPEDLLKKYIQNITLVFDAHSYYDLGLRDLFKIALDTTLEENSLNTKEISKSLLKLIQENKVYYTKLESFYNIIKNNHLSKLSDLPDNTIINLTNKLDIEQNWKGTNIVHTEIPPRSYRNDEIYRSSSTIKDYSLMSQNYFSYLGQHISDPQAFNGYNSKNIEPPTYTPGSDVLNISLINAKKGIYL